MTYLALMPPCLYDSLRRYYIRKLHKIHGKRKGEVITIEHSVLARQIYFLQKLSYLLPLIPLIFIVVVFRIHFEWDDTNVYLNKSLSKLFLIGLVTGGLFTVLEAVHWVVFLYKKIRYNINIYREEALLLQWTFIFTCYSMALICLIQYALKDNLYIVIR